MGAFEATVLLQHHSLQIAKIIQYPADEVDGVSEFWLMVFRHRSDIVKGEGNKSTAHHCILPHRSYAEKEAIVARLRSIRLDCSELVAFSLTCQDAHTNPMQAFPAQSRRGVEL